MTAAPSAGDRHVIPRWRSLAQTIVAGEFAAGPQRALTSAAEFGLLRAESDWRGTQTVSYASEFVGAALVLGVPERAEQAAEFLAESQHSTSTRALAGAALNRQHSGQIEFMTVTDSVVDSLPTQIAALKIVVNRDPRQVVAWLDLARMYTTLGRIGQAARALHIAVSLAPHNRFVLRSSVAFHSHIGDHQRAYELVRNHPATRYDPWLLAADLAATGEAGGRQVNVRHARSLIESGTFAPLAISELASELGSMEMTASSKRAKRLFATAMQDPTENAGAQVEWAVRSEPRLRTWVKERVHPGEAAARHAEQLRDWAQAARHGEFWLNDQPFSIDAGAFSSYAAAIAGDYRRAAQLAEASLRANPESKILINNLAYALIEAGELDRARDHLSKVPRDEDAGDDDAAIAATRGLLEIRGGNHTEGARLYRLAIERARAANSRSLEAQAWIMFALEMVSLGGGEGAIQQASNSAKGLTEPAVQELLARLIKVSTGPRSEAADFIEPVTIG